MGWVGSTTGFAVAIALPALLTGCKDAPGELDPDVVHDIARTPGDAQGLDLSGEYDAEIEPLTCDCPDIGTLEGLSLCQGSGPLSPMPGDKFFVTLEVVQTDGIVLMRYFDQSLTGGLNEDGTFAAGGLFDMDTLLTSGDVITRMDGEFDEDASVDQFEALIQHRLKGEAAPALAELDERTSVDCVETFDLQARRRTQ